MEDRIINSYDLAALCLMGLDRSGEGVNYMEFVRGQVNDQHLMEGATTLLDYGYAEKIPVGYSDDSNYRLTGKGREYLNDILKYAESHFD
ncbi:MAG: hypothetical protein AABW91_01105 [Nanoarchaeota archaeon]